MNLRALLALCALPAALSGCIQMDTLPEILARNQWMGRPAEDAISYFGRPDEMTPLADGQVVMRWTTDTSYYRSEVVGSSTEQQGNALVTTHYWDNVHQPNRCIISVTVDKTRTITAFEADDGELLLSSGCASIQYGPP